MKAVLLAAGEGQRLKPITATRPKPLINICGKPILEHSLEIIKSCGLTDIIIVTNYMGDCISQYFDDGNKMGLKITYIKQAKRLGTGNAVSAVESYVDEDFVLVYGDLLFAKNVIKNLISYYESEKPSAVMAVVPVEQPERYGVVELENEKAVKHIIEKPEPSDAPSNLANAGLYVFSKEIFSKLKLTEATVRGEWELTDALSLLIKNERGVLAKKFSKEDWIDVGRPWDLLVANSWLLKQMKHKVYGTVENGANLIGPVTVSKTAMIRSGAYIEGPTFIDEGSDIGPNCYIRPCTSIGKKVRIGNACEIKNSIIMDGSHVGHLSYVGDSIICEQCNLGAGTITANYRLDSRTVKMKIKDKMVDSGRRKLGAILGDNVKTGINALLMPGVKIGTNSWIGANFTVRKDVPANNFVFMKQDENNRKRNI